MQKSFKRPQQWNNADKDIRNFVHRVVSEFEDVLGNQLVGLYLHGSLAMGCFYRAKSDIDILVIVKSKLSPKTRKILAELCANLSDKRSTLGDLELSIIQQKYTKHFVHPLPFEVHYGSDWKENIRTGKVNFFVDRKDKDLAAHCMVVKKKGLRLYGPTINRVFGEVPWRAYMDAILDDIQWIVKNKNILESPFYGILNSCRILQLQITKKKLVASKEQAGLWALSHLPKKYAPIVRQALKAYRSPKQVKAEQRRTAGMRWNTKALLEFRDFVKKEVV